MKRPRPYIPLAVRIAVAERQLSKACEAHFIGPVIFGLYCTRAPIGCSSKHRLDVLLQLLFGERPYQLDHDPALILREFKKGRYFPAANDPAHLAYRTKEDHQQKTTGRKPGAERTVTTKGSDIGLKRKFAKLEKRTKASRRPKQKIPSRPFSKQKRGFR